MSLVQLVEEFQQRWGREFPAQFGDDPAIGGEEAPRTARFDVGVGGVPRPIPIPRVGGGNFQFHVGPAVPLPVQFGFGHGGDAQKMPALILDGF